MTQIMRISQALKRNSSGRGVTVARLAKLANTTRDSVYKRIHDLRLEGLNISSDVHVVNGERKTYYRLAS